MNYYLELRLLPDPEFASSLLLNALYNKLHLALVKLNSNDLGISFPQYRQQSANKHTHPLGACLRVHGTSERLTELMALNWLKGMHDHVQVGEINLAPNSAKYTVYRRVQVKSSAERIRRRQMRRHNLSYEEAAQRIPDKKILSGLPFVTIRSQSTEQIFKLFIAQQEMPSLSAGNFNTYGLSIGGMVPLF